jgi:uncharacterized protein (TIGR00251 family)
VIVRVRAKPNSRMEYIKHVEKDLYEVAVKEPPEDNRANKRIIEILAENFNVSKSNIKLVRGSRARIKIFEVLLG